jgi:hypothetical protein
MHMFATTTPEQMLQLGAKALVTEVQKPRSGSRRSPPARRTK